MRKVKLFIACSLDGYIAKPGDDLSFLSLVQKENEDYGYNEFIETVDTVIMGSRTYEWVVSQVDYPHVDKESFIISRNARPSEKGVHFYNGSLTELISSLKEKEGKDIFCDGGAAVVDALLKDKLIDEMIISVIPVLLGDGLRLFKGSMTEENLRLVSVSSFDAGLVQLHYQCLKTNNG